MKRRVNYALPVLIMIAVLGAMVYMAVTRKTDVVQDKNDKLYDDLMALDFTENYPTAPDKVLDAYNSINSFLSGNTNTDFSDNDLTVLLEKQRQLMDTELLASNPIESHITEYKNKIEYLEQEKIRILQINGETPVFSEDAKRCTIAVLQIWNKNLMISLVYNLKKEDDTGKWRIVGWFENNEAINP